MDFSICGALTKRAALEDCMLVINVRTLMLLVGLGDSSLVLESATSKSGDLSRFLLLPPQSYALKKKVSSRRHP